MEKYKDIIKLSHHISKKHPRLSMEQRAAQFAPFAALTGFGDEIKETIRTTESRIELDEEEKLKINNTLQKIKSKIYDKLQVVITYFVPDLKKSGGEYKTKTGNIKKIDVDNQLIIFEDKTKIPIREIIEILTINDKVN